jgi:hypothetical protein
MPVVRSETNRTPTPSPTPEQNNTITITGAVFLKPRWAIHTDNSGICLEMSSSTWLDYIDAAHTPDNPPFSLPSGTFGYVYLFDVMDNPLGTAPITQTSSEGKLSYFIPNLPAGTYHLRAFLADKGDDLVSRRYDELMQDGLPIPYRAFALTPQAVLGSLPVVDPLALELSPSVHLCP